MNDLNEDFNINIIDDNNYVNEQIKLIELKRKKLRSKYHKIKELYELNILYEKIYNLEENNVDSRK